MSWGLALFASLILASAGCTPRQEGGPALSQALNAKSARLISSPLGGQAGAREPVFKQTGLSLDRGSRIALSWADHEHDPSTGSYGAPRYYATQPSFSPDGLLLFSQRSFTENGPNSTQYYSTGLGVSIVDYAATTRDSKGQLGIVTQTGSADFPNAYPVHRALHYGTTGPCAGTYARRLPSSCGNTQWKLVLDDATVAPDRVGTGTSHFWHVTTFVPGEKQDNPYLSDSKGRSLQGRGLAQHQTHLIGFVGTVVSLGGEGPEGEADRINPNHPFFSGTAARDRLWSCLGTVTTSFVVKSGHRVPQEITQAGLLPKTCTILELTSSTPASRRILRGIEPTMTEHGDVVIFHSYYYPPYSWSPSAPSPGTGATLVSFRQQGSVLDPACLLGTPNCLPLRYSTPEPLAELYNRRNQPIPARNGDVPGVTYGMAYPLARNPVSTPKGEQVFLMSNPQSLLNIDLAYPWADPNLRLLTGISRNGGDTNYLAFNSTTQQVQTQGGLQYCLHSASCFAPAATHMPIQREGFDVINADSVAETPSGTTYPIQPADSRISEHRTLLSRVTSGSFLMGGAWSPMHRLPVSHFANFKLAPGPGAVTSFVSTNNVDSAAGPIGRSAQTITSQFEIGHNREGYLFYSNLAPSGDFVNRPGMPNIRTDFLEAMELSRNRLRVALAFSPASGGAFYPYNDPITQFTDPAWRDHARGFQVGRLGDGVSLSQNGQITVSERPGQAPVLNGYSDTLTVQGWFSILSNQPATQSGLPLQLARGPAFTISLRNDQRIELQARVANPANPSAPLLATSVSGQTIPIGTPTDPRWFHVVASFQLNPQTHELETRLYLNGTYSMLDRSQPLGAAVELHKDSTPWTFGPGTQSSNSRLIVMRIDEIGAINRALSPKERRVAALVPDPEPLRVQDAQRTLLGPVAKWVEEMGFELERAHVPADNPITAEKIALGRTLFNDPALSSTGRVSCATCHIAGLGFSSASPGGRTPGVTGVATTRATPSLVNLLFADPEQGYFMDGRAASLEEQVVAPFTHPLEMGLSGMEDVVKSIQSRPAQYAKPVNAAFGMNLAELKPIIIQRALATFMRSLIVGDSPYDRHLAGDTGALNASQRIGLGVFNRRCIGCHNGPMLSDRSFHNIGISPASDPDIGRMALTGNPLDRGAFITPGLRDLTLRLDKHAHDGRALMDLISNYSVGGLNRQPSTSVDVHAGGFTPVERQGLKDFLLEGLRSGKRSF